MKPFTEALLRNGIIDKTMTSLLAKWGTLAPEELEQLSQKQIVAETLVEFLEHLDELVEDTTLKETRLEIVVTKPPLNLFNSRVGNFSAIEDAMGHWIVSPKLDLCTEDALYKDDDMSNKPSYVITNIESIFSGSDLVAKQLTVEKI